MNLPVTYLIPVHGKPIFWQECLRSVADEPASEILILANGLDKNFSRAILKFIDSDERFKYVAIKNANLVKALNIGIERSDYNLIARMDVDDINIKGRTKLQYDTMQIKSELLVLGGQVRRFTQNLTKTKISKYPTGINNVGRALKKHCALAHPTVMLRRDQVLKVGGYRDYFKHGEDYDLWLRLSQIGEIDNLSSPLIYYREHANQTSTRYLNEQEFATRAAIVAAKKRSNGLQDLPLSPIEILKIRRALKFSSFSTYPALRRKNKKFLYFFLSFFISPIDFGMFTLGRVTRFFKLLKK